MILSMYNTLHLIVLAIDYFLLDNKMLQSVLDRVLSYDRQYTPCWYNLGVSQSTFSFLIPNKTCNDDVCQMVLLRSDEEDQIQVSLEKICNHP